jgi:sulfoxide reductase heme-binding subunit YedZ
MTRVPAADRLLWPAALSLCLVPLALLAVKAATGGLGANPIEATTRHLGWWGLVLLLTGLAVTPLRRLSGWNRLIRVRRMLGLAGFAYVALHWTSYVGLDKFFDWGDIWADLVKRPYITVGMLAFVLLVPLAITSTQGWVRRLGGRRWQRLHYLVYPVAALGVVHYFLLVKADVREPMIFAAVLAVLLGARAWWRATQRGPRAAAGRDEMHGRRGVTLHRAGRDARPPGGDPAPGGGRG